MIRSDVQIDSVVCGDALEILRTMESNSIDALVCDPPAGIFFMNAAFDSDRGGRDKWIAWLAQIMAEALRVLKPGAHALVWSLPKTSHWTMTALEDAGFQTRDCVYHLLGTDAKVQNFLASLNDEQRNALAELVESQAAPSAILSVFGSGFPKSTSVSKQIDRLKGAEREVIGKGQWANKARSNNLPVVGYSDPNNKRLGASDETFITAPATPEAQQWDGWGSSLKPAVEQWILCRKPLSEKNLAENVLKWGVGGLNIDGSRINTDEIKCAQHQGKSMGYHGNGQGYMRHVGNGTSHPQGRFPSHLLLSHTLLCTPRGTKRVRIGGGQPIEGNERKGGAVYNGLVKKNSSIYHGDADRMEEVEDWECHDSCPIRILGEQSGIRKSGTLKPHREQGTNPVHMFSSKMREVHYQGDQGSAARFFQQFHPATELDSQRDIVPFIYASKASRKDRSSNGTVENTHPTCKNVHGLMRYLVRLITPPGGVVLDCFCGSGSTLCAAVYEGMHFVGIDQDESYCTIAHARVQYALQHAQMAGDGP